jgi:hypothetical protein
MRRQCGGKPKTNGIDFLLAFAIFEGVALEVSKPLSSDRDQSLRSTLPSCRAAARAGRSEIIAKPDATQHRME